MGPSRSKAESGKAVTSALTQALDGWRRQLSHPPKICVAFSGGLDSTVLLHGLAELRPKLTLTAHHVHHGISANADQWVNHCQTICNQLEVPLTVSRITLQNQDRMGIEAAARKARYAALASSAISCDRVVLAHHQRDQAETLLLQALRGAGPQGLSAMPEVRPPYARPLLTVSKSALLAYASQHRLRWVEDESNSDNRYARNLLRNQVWPTLESLFPEAERTLARAALLQFEAATLLMDLAKIDATTCIDDQGISLALFRGLSAQRQANLFRYWLLDHCNMTPPPANTLREWLTQLSTGNDEQTVILQRGASDTQSPSHSIRIYRGYVRKATVLPTWEPITWTGETSVALSAHGHSLGDIRFSSTLTRPAFRAPRQDEHWQLRPRKAGDAIRLSPRSGHVALKNVLQNHGIPPWQRQSWPVLCCNDTIVSVLGLEINDAYGVDLDQCGFIAQWKPL